MEIDAGSVCYKDATELATLIRAKKLSSREVVQAHLDRIAAINPKINAIVTLLSEDVLKGADAADKAVAKGGSELGPFHGVPFTIKDAIDTAGVLTQRGSRIFTGNVPAKDATVVTRFKEAGGIPLAKTNLPEFSAWQETDNLLTGLTRNPWTLDRTPGGSSGGESAAIAAGLSPIGIGSDVAISVRGRPRSLASLDDFGIIKRSSSAVCFGPPQNKEGYSDAGVARGGGTRWTGEQRWSYSNRFGESTSSGLEQSSG